MYFFLSKGSNNYASVYRSDFTKAIASSAFIVIRPDLNRILPEYLAWYINASKAQEFLHAGKAGTFITNINMQTLKELEVFIPQSNLQYQIAALSELSKMEKRIMQKILFKKEVLINQILNTTIKQ